MTLSRNRDQESEFFQSEQFNKILSNGVYSWYVNCTDDSPGQNWGVSETRNITVSFSYESQYNFSLSSNIKYLILPAPHVLVENVKIFDNNLKINEKFLRVIRR